MRAQDLTMAKTVAKISVVSNTAGRRAWHADPQVLTIPLDRLQSSPTFGISPLLVRVMVAEKVRKVNAKRKEICYTFLIGERKDGEWLCNQKGRSIALIGTFCASCNETLASRTMSWDDVSGYLLRLLPSACGNWRMRESSRATWRRSTQREWVCRCWC